MHVILNIRRAIVPNIFSYDMWRVFEETARICTFRKTSHVDDVSACVKKYEALKILEKLDG